MDICDLVGDLGYTFDSVLIGAGAGEKRKRENNESSEIRKDYEKNFQGFAVTKTANVSQFLQSNRKQAKEGEGFFERAVQRMLNHWQSFRNLIGANQLLKYLLQTKNGIGYFRIIKGQRLEGLHLQADVCYYVGISGINQNASHAVALIPEGQKWFIYDPNGKNSDYAKELLKQLQELSQGSINCQVMETVDAQKKAFDSNLFKNGQFLGRNRGWCSLWTLMVIYMRIRKCNVAEIQKFINSDGDFSFVFMALRDETVLLFRRLCKMVHDSRWRRFFVEKREINEYVFDNIWKQIFKLRPGVNTEFTIGTENEQRFYSVGTADGEPLVKFGGQRFNQAHAVSTKSGGMYVKVEIKHNMVTYRIGLYTKFGKWEEHGLWALIKNECKKIIRGGIRWGETTLLDAKVYGQVEYSKTDKKAIDTYMGYGSSKIFGEITSCLVDPGNLLLNLPTTPRTLNYINVDTIKLSSRAYQAEWNREYGFDPSMPEMWYKKKIDEPLHLRVSPLFLSKRINDYRPITVRVKVYPMPPDFWSKSTEYMATFPEVQFSCYYRTYDRSRYEATKPRSGLFESLKRSPLLRQINDVLKQKRESRVKYEVHAYNLGETLVSESGTINYGDDRKTPPNLFSYIYEKIGDAKAFSYSY